MDAPEHGQPGFRGARRHLVALLCGSVWRVRSKGRCVYGRVLADLVDDKGRSISREMIKEGWAWWYKKYQPLNKELAELEKEARAERRGLWAEENPVPPWAWRRGGRGGTGLEGGQRRRRTRGGRATLKQTIKRMG